jgi:hypothetical protein
MRNRIQKLKIADFNRFIGDLWTNFAYRLRPAVAPKPIYHHNRPIPGSMSPVFPSPSVICSFSHRLRLHFRSDKMGKVSVLCSAESERENSIYVSNGQSGPIFIFLIQFEFYLIKRSRFEKFYSPIFLEFDLVFLQIFLFSF